MKKGALKIMQHPFSWGLDEKRVILANLPSLLKAAEYCGSHHLW
jgi:hypothetical protein